MDEFLILVLHTIIRKVFGIFSKYVFSIFLITGNIFQTRMQQFVYKNELNSKSSRV